MRRLGIALLTSAASAIAPEHLLLERADPVTQFVAQYPQEFATSEQWAVAREIVQAAEALDVPPELMLLRCWKESRLRTGLVNENQNKEGKVWSRDYGACQVNDYWTAEIVQQNWKERIWTATSIMRENRNLCGSWKAANRRYATGKC